jgi:hypothetical protein
MGLIAVLGLSVTSCTPDFEKVWDVRDLRVLALQADPIEVLVPEEQLLLLAGNAPSIRLQALAVDPRSPTAEYEWEAWACSGEEDHCDEAAVRRRVYPDGDAGAGRAWARSPLDQIAFDFVIDQGIDIVAHPEQSLLLAAQQADPFKGFGGVPVAIEIWIRDVNGGPDVRAIKRVSYGLIDSDGAGPPTGVPAGKQPNANPTLSVTVNGKPVPDPWLVLAEAQEVIGPQPAEEARQSYVVGTFDGGTEQLEEYLSYSFFATSGELSHSRTGGKPSPFVEDKKIADPTANWTAPAEPGPGTLWLVIRDDRGGVSWQRHDYQVTIPGGS